MPPIYIDSSDSSGDEPQDPVSLDDEAGLRGSPSIMGLFFDAEAAPTTPPPLQPAIRVPAEVMASPPPPHAPPTHHPISLAEWGWLLHPRASTTTACPMLVRSPHPAEYRRRWPFL